MRTVKKPEFSLGRENGARVLVMHRLTQVFPLKCGTGDEFSLFEENGVYIIICYNYRYDYLGVDFYEFDPDAGAWEMREEISIFCQGSEQVEELFGPKGLDYAPMTIARMAFRRMYYE